MAASTSNDPKEEGDWLKEVPHRFLADEIVWNDDDFLPEGGFKEYREEYRKIYSRYFLQVTQSNGFDIDVYPGKAKAAMYVPYLEFETEVDMLMELANHAIHEYNGSGVYKYTYKGMYIESVNFMLTKHREFFMTVKVKNLTLRAPMATFQIHAYKGFNGENIVSLCRRKGGEDVKKSDEVAVISTKSADANLNGEEGGM